MYIVIYYDSDGKMSPRQIKYIVENINFKATAATIPLRVAE